MGLFISQVSLQGTNEVMLCFKIISVVRQSFPQYLVILEHRSVASAVINRRISCRKRSL